jgi:hypothetical protein
MAAMPVKLEEREPLMSDPMRRIAGGGALLSAAAPLGYSLPRQYANAAASAQGALDTAIGDSTLLGHGMADITGEIPKGLNDLGDLLSQRAGAAQEALERAKLRQRAVPYLRAASVPLALGGGALVAKGLYDHFHKEGAAGALADLGLTKTALGMTLRFRSPEEAQEHTRNRNIIGALGGGLLGAGIGGAALGKRFGVPGAVVGGIGGAMLGAIPGKILADTAHDYRERTMSTYDDTMQRMNAAAGGNIRVASALDEFIEFADQDAQARASDSPDLANASGFQLDQEKRERPPGFGPPSALAGADVGTRMMQIGLPGSGAV